MAGGCIQDVVDGTSVQYVLVTYNIQHICGRRTMDAKDARHRPRCWDRSRTEFEEEGVYVSELQNITDMTDISV